MRESPRLRRLRNDAHGLEQLRTESTILDYTPLARGVVSPPEQYLVQFRGRGFWRPPGMTQVLIREFHEVEIRLGATYPRTMPDLRWRSPIFHPNISANGSVCLGGYGKNWVPGLQLAELCQMLWNMIRLENYDITSPFNREAAAWLQFQNAFPLPLDPRPIRDRVAKLAGDTSYPPIVAVPKQHLPRQSGPDVVFGETRSHTSRRPPAKSSDILYIE